MIVFSFNTPAGRYNIKWEHAFAGRMAGTSSSFPDLVDVAQARSLEVAFLATICRDHPRDVHRPGARPLSLPGRGRHELRDLPGDRLARDRPGLVDAHDVRERSGHPARASSTIVHRPHDVLRLVRGHHGAARASPAWTRRWRRRRRTWAPIPGHVLQGDAAEHHARRHRRSAARVRPLDRRLRDHELRRGIRRRHSRCGCTAPPRQGIPVQVNVIGTFLFTFGILIVVGAVCWRLAMRARGDDKADPGRDGQGSAARPRRTS